MNILTISLALLKVLKSVTTIEDKRRASICQKCPQAKYNRYTDFINDELKNVKGFVCTDCAGCPLIAKIRSKDICKKW